MTRELSRGRLSVAETASLRQKLRLRWNVDYDSWEVFTTIHGTGQHRWFMITESKKLWYQQQFPEIIITKDKP